MATPALAGAWTLSKGEAQTILTLAYERSTASYSAGGTLRIQGLYQRGESSIYREYGWRDGLTLGFRVAAAYAAQDVKGSITIPGLSATAKAHFPNYGLEDTELFARQRLWKGNNAVVSVQPFATIPGKTKREFPSLSNDHPDVGMKLQAGYSFKLRSKYDFADLAVGYRHRFGRPDDQVSVEPTLGIYLTDRLMALPQVFITQRLDSRPQIFLNQSPLYDNNSMRGQLSAVYSLNDSFRLQVGAFHDFRGDLLSRSTGGLISLWTNF